MKEILQLMAEYNKAANGGMMDILKTLPEERLKKDTGIFFKSIEGTFEHILACDIMFFGIFREYAPDPAAFNDPIFALLAEGVTLKPEAKKDTATLFSLREKMDDIIIGIIGAIEDFSSEGSVPLPGLTVTKHRYQLILHELNHDTHHRGQIAAVLDQMNVQNDFSNLLTVV